MFYVTVTFLSDEPTASEAMDDIMRQLPDDLEWHYMSAGRLAPATRELFTAREET